MNAKTISMLDISGYGVEVHGHPIAAVDLRLVETFETCNVHGPEALAEALNTLLAAAFDGEDEGHPAGTLYWARANFIRPDGVERIYVHAEESTCGWVLHIPEILDEDVPA